MLTIHETMLRDVAKATVGAVDPEQIILFGPYATGEVGPDSRLNLLVVERGPLEQQRRRRMEMHRICQALAGFRVPVDVVVFTPEEMTAWRGGGDHVIARAMREGRSLYERPAPESQDEGFGAIIPGTSESVYPA
jgi:predicted nucleotidyltransferase